MLRNGPSLFEIFNSINLTNIHIEKALVLPSDPNIHRIINIIVDDNSHLIIFSKSNQLNSGDWIKHMKVSKGDSISIELRLATGKIQANFFLLIFLRNPMQFDALNSNMYK